jgi:glycosyltransferase involved in cell wall biosynthesis
MLTAKYGIILPVRNGGEYVKECVASILGQSLPDLDLHVLDNSSTDGTLEWLRTLTDSRVHIYPSDRSLSIEENWGRILPLEKNEYITLIGHDDLLDTHYLATMDALIGQHPNAALYQAHFRYIDSKGSVIRRCKPMDARQSAVEFLAFFLAGLIDNMGTGYMMRSAAYDAVGGMPPYPNLLFADFELWIELSKGGYKATAVEETFSFRLHQSMTTTSSDMKYRQAFGRFIDYLAQVRSGNPAMEEVVRRYSLLFLMTYCKGLSHRLLRTPLKKRNNETVAQFITGCRAYADRLVPGNDFNPYQIFSMRLARRIDGSALTRAHFLLFKRLYPKPVMQ